MTASKILTVCGVLLISTPVIAQAGPVAQKSSDQIICEISGDCGAVDPSLATQDKPENRGFRIAGPARPAAGSNPAAQQNNRVVTPPQRPAMTGPSRARFAIAPHQVGRSDLAINFISGSANLTDSGRSQAQQFVKALSAPQLAGKRYQVVGHTDAVGGRAYNLDLSQRRAQAVVDFLVQSGANRSQFDVKGVGFDKPADARNPKAAVNRRVEFVKID